jgi:hypothetical protein
VGWREFRVYQRRRPNRVATRCDSSPLAIMKFPGTPFFLGFSANIHQNFGLGNSTTVDNAKNNLRFLFGAKFDAGKLFSGLSIIH